MTITTKINRYRLERHDELPEGHQAEYRARGIDPATLWSLLWSFENREAAEKMKAEYEADAPSWATYRIVDAGATQYVEVDEKDCW